VVISFGCDQRSSPSVSTVIKKAGGWIGGFTMLKHSISRSRPPGCDVLIFRINTFAKSRSADGTYFHRRGFCR
jgi:hypothetical protein